MEVTWTRRLWHLAAAAGLGAACFLASAVGGLAQTTGAASSGASQAQPRSQVGQSASRTAQRTTEEDETQGIGRSQSGTYSNRPGTSDYGQSQSSQARGTQSGFGSTQTGRARSDAQSASEYSYGPAPAGGRQPQDARREARDTARDSLRDTRDQSRDAIGEARDDMRSTARSARDQFQDSRFTRDEDREGFARDDRMRPDQQQDLARGQRDFTREEDQDISREQRDFARDDRDFERGQQRDEFDDQGQFARDQRGQQRDQLDDQRRFSRDDRGQQRDFARDEDAERFQPDRFGQDRFQQPDRFLQDTRRDWQDDRRSQSARFDQRDDQRSRATADFRSRTDIRRAADIGLWFDRGARDSLVISDVASSGPITRFGFREGDQIISVNGTRVTSEQAFIELLLSPRVMNQRVQVIVWRSGQQVTIWVEPWVLVQGTTTVAQADPLEVYGVILDDRYSYPVVWRVLPRSAAFYAGIRPGDVIVAWSGRYVYNPDDLVTLVQQSPRDEIAVQVSRNRQLRQLTLEAAVSQSRTALRPDFDQSLDSRTDARGTFRSDQDFGIRGQTDATWQQQGAYQGQRTGTQRPSGTTWGQAGTYGAAPGYGQTGAYGQAGVGTYGTYGQAGISAPGAYGQAGGYVQPGSTGQQQGGILRGGGILGGRRDR